jgi:hypothetical protein
MVWRGGRLAVGVVVFLTTITACAGPWSAPTPAAAVELPIPRENRLPGSTGWALDFRGSGISGYVVPASVDAGGQVGIAVSTVSPTYDLAVYRVGWYGGTGGRLVQSVRGLPGVNQGTWKPQTFGVSACSTCEYDARTGLLEPRWLSTHTFTIPRSWVSGDYLVHMTTPAGDVASAHFVVTDDRRASQVLAVLPLNTYEAYNNWGGKSLYGTNSTGPATLASGPFASAATEVSLERPYASVDRIRQDFEAVAFLERAGYDVTYATSVDLDRDPALLTRHRIFISVGHDEYWSRDMRDRVEGARDAGTSLVFLGGNDVYWQVRYRQGADGADRSILVCYRSAAIDPVAQTDPALTTVRFSEPPLLRPASTLTGTVYTDPILVRPAAWLVAATAPGWLLAGTGLVPGRGSIAGLVGVECDRYDPYGPAPPQLVVVSDSPVVKTGGAPSHCNTVYYRAAHGGQVFSAGTWSWEDFLTGRGQDAAVVRMTNNLLVRFGASPSTPRSD